MCGADRDRTDGLLVANEALSQLSYSPRDNGKYINAVKYNEMAMKMQLRYWFNVDSISKKG